MGGSDANMERIGGGCVGNDAGCQKISRQPPGTLRYLKEHCTFERLRAAAGSPLAASSRTSADAAKEKRSPAMFHHSRVICR